MLHKLETRQLQNKRAVSLIEYGVFILTIVLALIMVQGYLKKAICGKWKASVDVFGYGRQYQP